MGNTIQWETDYATTLKKAQTDKKPILHRFLQPGLNWLPTNGCSYVSKR